MGIRLSQQYISTLNSSLLFSSDNFLRILQYTTFVYKSCHLHPCNCNCHSRYTECVWRKNSIRIRLCPRLHHQPTILLSIIVVSIPHLTQVILPKAIPQDPLIRLAELTILSNTLLVKQSKTVMMLEPRQLYAVPLSIFLANLEFFC